MPSVESNPDDRFYELLREVSDRLTVLEQGAQADVPVGCCLFSFRFDTPGGYLLCDGATYLKASYPALATALGSPFSVDANYFRVPDMRGRVPVGLGTAAQVAAMGQSEGEGVGSRRPQHGHGHSLGVNGDGSHSHNVSVSGSTSGVGDHNHLARDDATPSVTQGSSNTGADGSARRTTMNERYYTGNAGGHSHSFSGSGGTDSQGYHGHSMYGSVGWDTREGPAYLVGKWLIRALATMPKAAGGTMMAMLEKGIEPTAQASQRPPVRRRGAVL